MNTPPTGRSPEEQQFYEAMTQGIGEAVLKLLPTCDRLGWDSPAGARPYLHPTSISAGILVDFIDWTLGTATDAALDRLRGTAAAWGFTEAAMVAALPAGAA